MFLSREHFGALHEGDAGRFHAGKFLEARNSHSPMGVSEITGTLSWGSL